MTPTFVEDDRRVAILGTLEPLERPFGNMQAVLWDKQGGKVEAASDPRGLGFSRVVKANSLNRE
jgi:gamma-glutamyltranspeptidase